MEKITIILISFLFVACSTEIDINKLKKKDNKYFNDDSPYTGMGKIYSDKGKLEAEYEFIDGVRNGKLKYYYGEMEDLVIEGWTKPKYVSNDSIGLVRVHLGWNTDGGHSVMFILSEKSSLEQVDTSIYLNQIKSIDFTDYDIYFKHYELD